MFADDKSRPDLTECSVFDRHTLFLVRVAHGTRIETNGVVIAECAPTLTENYLDMLIQRALQDRADGKGAR